MFSDDFDLGFHLGASESVPVHKFTIYLPNKDRDRQEVEKIEEFIEAGMWLLAQINRGVTRLPASQGIWFEDDEVVGDLDPDRFEDTVLIYSFLVNPALFQERIDDIRRFLHKFGRETNQGEVMVEFFGERIGVAGVFCRNYKIKFPRLDS